MTPSAAVFEIPIHVKKNGNRYPTRLPALHRKLWMEYARPFCFSLTMSPTSILNGCMAIFIDVSKNISDITPNIMALLNVKWKLPAFGSRHMTITAINAPKNR